MQFPKPLRILYDWWMRFAHVLGICVSTVLLTVLWLVGFGTYAIVRMILRRVRPPAPAGDTYWRAIEPPMADHWKYQF